MKMDRKELFAHIDYWAIERDFWKSDTNDWEDIFQPLIDKGFTFDEAREIIESVIGLTRQEYGE